MNQVCALCEQPKILRESHLIPKFVFRWLKQTGGEHIRKADNPNKRVNDGLKPELLCHDCEQKFGKLEDKFAREIFYPYVNKGEQNFEYDNYLFQFAVSVLWRVAIYSLPRASLHHKSLIESTLTDWRGFLNGEKQLPNTKRIHIFFTTDRLKQNTQPVERFLNYWARGADGTIASGTNTCLVYAKLARVMLLGEISSFDSTGMVNTLINQSGKIDTSSMKVNWTIKDFIIDRVKLLNTHYDKVSDRQLNIALDNTDEQLKKMEGSDIWNIAQQESNMTINPNNFDFV